MTRKKEKAKERRNERMQEIAVLRSIPYSDDQRWWSSETVAVVTGSNRGIGYEIARQLADHGLKVILTARDQAVGKEAATTLQESGFNVDFHQLDVLDQESIKTFCEWIQKTYGGVDILVNNAGVNYNLGYDNSVEFAHQVLDTNYFGIKRMIKAMVPLMRHSSAGARVVNVSSRLGRLNGRRNRIDDIHLRQQLSCVDTLTEELIDGMVSNFLRQVDDGTWESGGWPKTFTDYSISKLAVSAFTRLTAKELSERAEGVKINMNCYCPGWVKTAMTGWAGNSSVEFGADTGVWLSLLPPNVAVSGKLFAERREVNF
ncbi:hypothetical protein ACFE04_024441 [Oxalis oulophora]